MANKLRRLLLVIVLEAFIAAFSKGQGKQVVQLLLCHSGFGIFQC